MKYKTHYCEIDKENEYWVDLNVVCQDLKPFYEISNCGRIRNSITGNILKQRVTKGYCDVGLYLDTEKRK